MNIQDNRLKRTLDRLYDEYDFQGRVAHDPIEFPHKYSLKEDIEAAAFISTCLAYGKVSLFKPVIGKILSAMGQNPGGFLREFSAKRHGRLFDGTQYRFNRTADIVCLLHAAGSVLKTRGSLEGAFMACFRMEDEDAGRGLAGMVEELLSVDTVPVYGKDVRPPGFLQFLPSPKTGSACKRMNLFLRWMVRDKDIDFGLWKAVPKDRLVIPLDTHIARIARCLELSRRSSADWKMAVEISRGLRRFDPEDPIKYDFALCHLGISGLCSEARCQECEIKGKIGGL